jgi:hypothetical protein
MLQTGQVECLLWVAWVASGVGRGWAVVEADQPWASCQAFVEHQPSLDAFGAVAAFLAVNGRKKRKKIREVRKENFQKSQERLLTEKCFPFLGVNCVKSLKVQRLIVYSKKNPKTVKMNAKK